MEQKENTWDQFEYLKIHFVIITIYIIKTMTKFLRLIGNQHVEF